MHDTVINDPANEMLRRVCTATSDEAFSDAFRRFGAEFLSFVLHDGWSANEDAVEFFRYALTNRNNSNAQLFQDLWVFWRCGEAGSGFFVDIGAGDGTHFSNSLMLEQRGWKGVLCEPNPLHVEALSADRTNEKVYACVSSAKSPATFRCTSDPDFSSLIATMAGDSHFERQRSHDFLDIEVDCVTPFSLLRKCEAPPIIDYLSVDTEGAELEILEAFPFDSYQVRFASIEHNYTSNRQTIHDLMAAKGFQRELEAFSRWDDWYVRRPA